jgi:phospholipase C
MLLSLALVPFALGAAVPPRGSGLNNIKNVVVLVQENLSFDHLAGSLIYNENIDGLVDRIYCNPANVSHSHSSKVCARDEAANIATDDPNHSISGINMQIFGTYHPLAKASSSMDGFITEQRASYQRDNLTRAAEVIDYFTPDHIPVFKRSRREFCPL